MSASVGHGHRHPPTWLLHGGRPASRWLIRRWCDGREHRSGQVPSRGPVIVAANHTGVIDGPGAVGIFPEGNRGAGDLTRFHNGAAYLALVTGAPIVPLVMFGTRPAGGGKNALPVRHGVVDLVYGAPFRVERTPWPRTSTLVAATSEALHARMGEELAAGLALTGQSMPGPIPADEAREIS